MSTPLREPLLVAFVAAVTSAVLPAPAAEASLVLPAPAIFPQAGALPPNPTLYRFEPTPSGPPAPPLQLRITGPDGPVPFTTRVLATQPVRITAIGVALAAGDLTIDAGRSEPVRRYRVGPGAPPPTAALQASKAARLGATGACDRQGLAVTVELPGVAVVVARWTDGDEALIVPDVEGYYVSFGDAPLTEEPPGPALIVLGDAGCRGSQLPRGDTGRDDVTLTVVYADGARRAVVLPPIVDERQPTEAERLAALVQLAAATTTDDPPRPPGALPIGWIVRGSGALGARLRGVSARWRRPGRAR